MNKKYDYLACLVKDGFTLIKTWEENNVPELLGWKTSPRTFTQDIWNRSQEDWKTTESHLRKSDSEICQDIIEMLDERYD